MRNIKISKKEEKTMLTQQEMIEKYQSLILKEGKLYEKFAKVEVRDALPGEKIETKTSSGVETVNTANSGDFVVRNPTGEEYILTESKLKSRYTRLDERGKNGWEVYQAKGQVMAIEYMGEDFKFTASWNESMVCNKGDMLCVPMPNKDEVYRIDKKEFEKTYKIK